jgi:hydrogenase-4 transcriptional activator
MHQAVRPLSAHEMEQLKVWATDAKGGWRAKVVLLSAEGKGAADISKILGFHCSNVKKWIRRFNEQGLDGIVVRKRGPRGGPKPRFSSDQVERILELASLDPASLGLGFRKWSAQKLALAAVELGIVERISQVTVRQILSGRRHSEADGKQRKLSLSGGGRRGKLFLILGKEAAASADFERAVEYLRSALSEGALSQEEEATARTLLSQALEELSRYEEAYDVIRQYEAVQAQAVLSAGLRARVRLRIGWVHSHLRRVPEAIASLNEAKKLFLELQDELGVSEAHYALGRTYIEINEFRIARDHLLAAVGAQQRAVDRQLLARIYNQLGTVDLNEGAFSSACENYRKALELADGSANTNLLGAILLNLGTAIHLHSGQREQSDAHYKQAIVYLEKGGHKRYLATAYNNLGDNLRYYGLWSEAIEYLNKSIETAEQVSDFRVAATACITLAEILSSKGEFSEAESYLKRSLEWARSCDDKWLESNALRIWAQVQSRQGHRQAALKSLRQALRLSTSIGDLHGVTLAQIELAAVHLLQGGLDQAREYIELAQGRLKEEESLFVSGLVQRFCGQLEASSGRFAEARQHIAQSISIFSTAEIPYELARSYYEMGLLLEKAGDASGSLSNLEQARGIFEKLGAKLDLGLVEEAISRVASGKSSVEPSCTQRSAAKVEAINEALLMQRLIEASNSRELLIEELAAVIFENFKVSAVAICKVQEDGQLHPLVSQGMNLSEAKSWCSGFTRAVIEKGGRELGSYLVRLDASKGDCGAFRHRDAPLIVCIRGAGELDVRQLQPLLKQAELGLEICSLRALARGAVPAKVEARVQTVMPGFIIGSASMFRVIDQINKIRTSDSAVLITGESGTGKELVARAIHAESARARAIFLPFNCTATPKDLIDSQLFGHRRGAFTGAMTNYPGIIRAAEGGTLFLDEIGDLALEVQPKLMRFLQEGEIQPLGETRPIKVDVRVIAATNTDLERAVAEGRFREDLFHRLNIIRIHVPPLRDRREEIPILASHFLEHFSARSGKQGIVLTQEAIDALSEYDWPGNVRQLRNEIERLVAYASDGARLVPRDLSSEITAREDRRRKTAKPLEVPELGLSAGGLNLKEATAALERRMITEALIRNGNNLSRAALDLGLSRRGLRLKIAQLGIERNPNLGGARLL